MSATQWTIPFAREMHGVTGQRYAILVKNEERRVKNFMEYVGKHKFRYNLPFTRYNL